MKNTKKYIICLFSFLAFFLIACEKNKKNKKEEEKVLVCSDITAEPECDKKSNCEWLDNVCKDKQSNDEETSENDEENLGNNEENLEDKSGDEPKDKLKEDKSAKNKTGDEPKDTLKEDKSESESKNNTDDKSNDSSADEDSEKSEVVVAFNPTKCSDYVGDKLGQCGEKNLTPKNAKDRIVCDIVKNRCENVKKCENIKVPKIEQGKNKGQIITTSPEAQRCSSQGCFVRESSGIFSDTCHTNPAKK